MQTKRNASTIQSEIQENIIHLAMPTEFRTLYNITLEIT